MATGDGLLVRLRPVGGALSMREVQALASAAARYGNGRLDVTARGNLQVRGLRDETVAPFAAALAEAGIVVESGTAVEVPPLAGLDRTEYADPRPLAAQLRALAKEHVLAPKCTVIVNGGGQLSLAGQSADLRFDALDQTRWRLALGGSVMRAAEVATVEASAISEAGRLIFAALAARGPSARGRDLDPGLLRTLLLDNGLAEAGPVRAARVLDRLGEGRVPLAPIGHLEIPGCPVLGVAPAFGQVRAEGLEALAEAAEACGANALRPAPGRALLFTGMSSDAITALAERAVSLGFSADPADPVHRIAACTGRVGCASGGLDTQGAARRLLAAAPSLFDGSVVLHLSGCQKGCAHPASATLVLVATPSGPGLVVGGTASSLPLAYQDEAGLGAAASALARLVEVEKQVGESVAACLKRLDPAQIAAVFSRGASASGPPRQD